MDVLGHVRTGQGTPGSMCESTSASVNPSLNESRLACVNESLHHSIIAQMDNCMNG